MDMMGETRAMEKNKTKKFTLCEICILFFIIGIAGSVFTPGITQAVQEKKLSDMVDRLHTIRSCIRQYKVHNDGLLPGQRDVGDPVTAEQFISAMAQQNPDTSEPYLREILDNPYIEDVDRQSEIICVNDANATPTGFEGAGWWFNAATGDFFACDSKFHTNY